MDRQTEGLAELGAALPAEPEAAPPESVSRRSDTPYTLSQLEPAERTELFERLSREDPVGAANLLETLPDAQGSEIQQAPPAEAAVRIVEKNRLGRGREGLACLLEGAPRLSGAATHVPIAERRPHTLLDGLP